jgi:hypothetical protein
VPSSGGQPVQTGRPLERARLASAAGSAPQGRPGLLQRAWQERNPFGLVIRARVAGLVAGPQGEHKAKGFIQLPSQDAVVGIFAEPAHLAVGIDAQAHAQGQAAAGKVIQADGLPGEPVGLPAGKGGNGGPDAHAASPCRDRRQRRPGVPNLPFVAGPAQYVVPQEEPVPAGLLCGNGQVNQPAGVSEIVERRQEHSMTHTARLSMPSSGVMAGRHDTVPGAAP